MAAARKANRPGIGSGRWRSAELPTNAVTDAVQRLGGPYPASDIGDVRPATVYAWCRKGAVLHLEVAVRWAEHLERGESARWRLVRALAGRDD